MFNIGDRVIVRTVDEMKADGFKLTISASSKRIHCDGFYYDFVSNMYELCGNEYVVVKVDEDDGKQTYELRDENEVLRWVFQDYMLKPYKEIIINPFTDSDLSLLMGV